MIRLTREGLLASICGAQVAAHDSRASSYLTLHYEPTGPAADPDGTLAFDRLVLLAILGSAGAPFFAITPLTSEIRAAPEVTSRLTDSLADSGLGYLPRNEHDLEALLAQRRRLSSYEEWVLGCCTGEFVRPREARWFQKVMAWNTDTFCAQIERITCLAVYYGETGEAVLWTSSSAELEEFIRRSGVVSEG
jgi:hypothetical protein